MTPDEFRYSMMARGVPVPRPFHYRWALPWLLGANRRSWVYCQWCSLLALGALLGAYTGEWWTVLLPFGLSGVMFNLKHPMLVDLPAMVLALGAAVAWRSDVWWAAVVLVLVAGCVKETGPVFAAVYAWSPVLLVGLIPVGVRHLMRTGPDPISDGPARDALVDPVRVAWEHHKGLPLWVYVLPWGLLLLGLGDPTPQLWVVLALAYGQLVVATDTVRLYVWALPVLALQLPALGAWWLLAVVLHFVNPFKTEGV